MVATDNPWHWVPTGVDHSGFNPFDYAYEKLSGMIFECDHMVSRCSFSVQCLGIMSQEEMLRIATPSNYIGSESLVNDTAAWMFLWSDVDDLLSSLPCEEVAVPVSSWFCSCTSQRSAAACGAGAHGRRGPTSHSSRGPLLRHKRPVSLAGCR